MLALLGTSATLLSFGQGLLPASWRHDSSIKKMAIMARQISLSRSRLHQQQLDVTGQVLLSLPHQNPPVIPRQAENEFPPSLQHPSLEAQICQEVQLMREHIRVAVVVILDLADLLNDFIALLCLAQPIIANKLNDPYLNLPAGCFRLGQFLQKKLCMLECKPRHPQPALGHQDLDLGLKAVFGRVTAEAAERFIQLQGLVPFSGREEIEKYPQCHMLADQWQRFMLNCSLVISLSLLKLSQHIAAICQLSLDVPVIIAYQGLLEVLTAVLDSKYSGLQHSFSQVIKEDFILLLVISPHRFFQSFKKFNFPLAVFILLCKYLHHSVIIIIRKIFFVSLQKPEPAFLFECRTQVEKNRSTSDLFVCQIGLQSQNSILRREDAVLLQKMSLQVIHNCHVIITKRIIDRGIKIMVKTQENIKDQLCTKDISCLSELLHHLKKRFYCVLMERNRLRVGLATFKEKFLDKICDFYASL